MTDAHTNLLAWLHEHNVAYRLIDHAPEGRTDLVSQMRGHDVKLAAKCMVLMIKLGKKVTRYALGVVPGDKRIDFDAIKHDLRATYVSFADPQVAEAMSGSVVGTVLPFSFNPDLEVIVDPSLLDNEEMYFNAGRLDRSMAMKTADYVALTNPRIVRIAKLTDA
jgi:Ala-tRNA(Pro) deacylase